MMMKQEVAIRAQVVEMFASGQGPHNARALVPRDDYSLVTASKHQFKRSFIGLSPQQARQQQRGLRDNERGHAEGRNESCCIMGVAKADADAKSGDEQGEGDLEARVDELGSRLDAALVMLEEMNATQEALIALLKEAGLLETLEE